MYRYSVRGICERLLPTIVTVGLLWAGVAAHAAVTVHTAYNFTGLPSGALASSSLVEDASGNFYGTVGPGSYGCLYELSKVKGVYQSTDLHDFDYSSPYSSGVGSLVLVDGVLYGTTLTGGTGGYGVVFSYDISTKVYTEIHDFSGPDGAFPTGGVFVDNGVLFGTTYSGGPIGEDGEVYALDEDGGNFGVLHAFEGESDGDGPECGLIKGTDGNLYGVTSGLLSGTDGTVFLISENAGNYSVLHMFSGKDGANPGPGCGLVDIDAELYGTTLYGGAKKYGSLFEMAQSGSGFTTLHSFSGNSDAGEPGETLVAASGLIFGTAGYSFLNDGAIFEYNPTSGAFAVEYKFKDLATGGSPLPANLTLASGDMVWGVTQDGGADEHGTAYYFKP